MKQVFISHTVRDKDLARSLAQALRERGVRVWSDVEIQPGEVWLEELESRLRSSDLVVALLDAEPHSVPDVYFELGAAIGMGKRIVPVVPEGTNLNSLPVKSWVHSHLVWDTAEHLADELSQTLQAA